MPCCCCNCNFNFDFLALFREEILQCLFPRKSLKTLRWEIDLLVKKKDVIINKVQELKQNRPEMRCKRTLDNWIKEVEEVNSSVTRLFGSSALKGLRRCSCKFRHSLGGKIDEYLRRIKRLVEDSQGFDGGTLANLLEKKPPARVEEIQLPTPPILGTEGMLSEILDYLQHDHVRVIGIHGVGGIGKTTIMKQLNNLMLSYENSHQFDMVIWVTVSQDVDIYSIQQQIGDRLGRALLEDRKQRAATLFQVLKDKKFLILLDDLWEKLKLDEVGIPTPGDQNNGRIVLTTRSHYVCLAMNANRHMKVDFLDEDKSRELFCVNLGPCVDFENNYTIQEYSEIVIRRCGGLPLALITVAKAFGGYGNNTWGWEAGLDKLMNSPSDIQGMEEDLLALLKFSFDRLPNQNLQQCLLYCSLYPYDCNINKSNITEQWVGEGLIYRIKGLKEGYASLRRKANDAILQLKSASLLENSLLGDLHYRMHDAVRDMCLKITQRSEKSSSSIYGEFHVYNIANDSNHYDLQDWVTSTKVSFANSRISYLDDGGEQQHQNCHSLRTLSFFNCKRLTRIHNDFFKIMHGLRLLDFSYTKLKELPTSICSLVELRFLGLKGTDIEYLPKELGNLSKLKQLYLEDTFKLTFIPKEALSKLSMLQCLGVLSSSFVWGLEGYDDSLIQLKDLKDLKNLDDLGLTLFNVPQFEELLNSFSQESGHSKIAELSLCGVAFTNHHVSIAYSNFLMMRRLWVTNCNVYELVLPGGYHSFLEEIVLRRNTNLTSIIVTGEGQKPEEDNIIYPQTTPFPKGQRFPLTHLREIYMQECHSMQNLSCIWHIPSLEWIRLFDCRALEVILPEAVGHQIDISKTKPFPRLQYIQLDGLPNIKRISDKCPLSFPSIKNMYVLHCPKLKKLPFDLESAKNIKRIRGSREWWSSIDWDDDRIRSALNPRFHPVLPQG